MSERPLLIVKTGRAVDSVRAFAGDFEHWITRAMGRELSEVRVAPVFEGAELPSHADIGGVIVTGSPAFVTDREPWSERSASWLAGAIDADLPILGICYGHQLIAHALGGVVGRNPRGREIGTIEVDLSAAHACADPLLEALPARAALHATHVESVLELPPAARVLGHNAFDPHHAFALGDRVWGVQFHPEFDAQVMRGYLDARAEVLRAEGLDPDALAEKVQESPAGKQLLQRFAEIVDELRG